MMWVELKDGKPNRVHWDKNWFSESVEAVEKKGGNWFVLKRPDNEVPILIFDNHSVAAGIANVNGMTLSAVERVEPEKEPEKQKLIQLDAEPQQTVLGNLQTGLQIVATINIENVIDDVVLNGQEQIASLLGNELLELLKVNGSLANAIDPQKHVEKLTKHVAQELGLEDGTNKG